jgi:hypothetical protein
MRFEDLRGLTTIPIERARGLFADDPIITVLPVTCERPVEDSILVATPRKLAVVTWRRHTVGGSVRGRFITRWARWEVVGLGTEPETDGEVTPPTVSESIEAEESTPLRIAVQVGRRRFHTRLRGTMGRAALRDFVDAVQRGTRRYIAYVDYDAASMLP